MPTRGSLYVRSAYRNDPDFSVGTIGRLQTPTESLRIERLIQNDQSVAENYQRLVYQTMASVYDEQNDEKTVGALREELIGKIRISMNRVFGDLLLNNISNPLGDGTFMFKKGKIDSYQYKNLSGGEKSAFDLILDLHIKSKFHGDAIYCIDELDTHLHTRIQGRLLRELAAVIPEGAQLWVTTHSLGVLRAAQQMSVEAPGSVALIDFDGVDPDVPAEIEPSNLGRVAWEKMLSVALDDLSDRISPAALVVCEGSQIGGRRKDFDAEIYNRIFLHEHPGIVFISGGASNQVTQSGVEISKALRAVMPSAKVVSLIDRDDKSDSEVAEFESGGNLVLSRRNLESYLFDCEIIMALLERENKINLIDEAKEIIDRAMNASVARGNPPDDVKSAAGTIYIDLKKLLQLQRCGNNVDSFMRDTLGPLIKPGMRVYKELRRDIWARIPR
jgi:hypothetical protein